MNDPVFVTLLFAQVVMGGFDTVYHHELTQRLAWKPGQATELRLHGVRNMIYALVFLMLGWTEPHGLAAMLLIGALSVELGITLWDFVEEDRVRALPASERVTHTVLTLNYGVLLAMLAPTLVAGARQPTALVVQAHGIVSLLLTVSAIGVMICGIRDLFAAARNHRLDDTPAGELAAMLGPRKAVLVTGGTGFVGRRLVAALVAAGHDVTVLTRDARRALGLVTPLRIVTDLAMLPDDFRCDVAINLAGEPIAARRWTAKRRELLIGSRLEVTRALLALVARLERRPEVLISGSAIGFYGIDDKGAIDESVGQGKGFAAELCARWETEARRAEGLGVRTVLLRTGLVLGNSGGMLAGLLPIFETGLGGPVGNGRQMMSWIHRDDLVRLIIAAAADAEIHGALNATAPNPVSSAAFAKALGKALHRPAILPLPAAPLRVAIGGLAEELLLGGQKVLPVKAIFHGFRFRYPRIEQALGDCVGHLPERLTMPARPFVEARLLH
ncbi:TIGR01777 family oxidoreductase [Sphingomonas alpina]|uniref:TIGR01777 family protein n=1 Tax=Sphingomonas alpina TaxID=653931 RepID=A0A7H0LQ06_9SPHN|nr:TIGR01777 family oxidoreductase [Sphingomonas alpina]QNQ11759.1 TIGR01777 family protein [Sphingomonas alpina]